MNLFNIILDIERSRSKFFDNRRLRSKSSDPQYIWADTINQNFLGIFTEVVETSMLLFRRYKDEAAKTLSNDQTLSPILKETILQNFLTNLELLTLLNSYVDFLQTVLKPEKDKNLKNAIVTIEKNYGELLTSYFEYSIFAEDKKISNYLNAIESANTSFRMSRRLQNMGYADLNQEIETMLTQSDYFLKNLPDFLREIYDDIWYEDDLLLSHAQKDAINRLENLDQMVEEKNVSFQLKSRIENLKENELAEVQAFQKFSEAKFLTKVAKVRIKSFEIDEASIELKSAIHSLEQVFSIIGLHPKNSKIKKLYHETVYLFEQFSLINLLVNLNLELGKVLEGVKSEDKEKVVGTIKQMKTHLQSHDFNFDIQYLSALPTIYENVIENIELIFANHVDFEKVSYSISKNFENIERRIVIATNQIVNKFENVIIEDDMTQSKFAPTLEAIEILQLANALLPTFTPSKNHNNNRFQILEHLGNSVLFELKAFSKVKDSPLKELIFKTKAYHHANLAYFQFNNLGTKDVPISRIKAHYSGSFISANKLLIDLYKSIVQYICIDSILPNFYDVITDEESYDEYIYQHWQQKLNFDNFIEMLQHIIKSSQIIFEHYQIHGTVVSGINWEGIKQVEQLSKGILQYLKGLSEVVLGTIAIKIGNKEDAVIHFTEAKSEAYKASENLQLVKIPSSEVRDIAGKVYNFARFCQESSNNPSNHNLMNLPISDAIKLLRDLVFSI